MVAWQPESGLSSDECNDLRLARYSKFVHHLRRIGESAPEWEEGIMFSLAPPALSPWPVVELILASNEDITAPVVEVPQLEVA